MPGKSVTRKTAHAKHRAARSTSATTMLRRTVTMSSPATSATPRERTGPSVRDDPLAARRCSSRRRSASSSCGFTSLFRHFCRLQVVIAPFLSKTDRCPRPSNASLALALPSFLQCVFAERRTRIPLPIS